MINAIAECSVEGEINLERSVDQLLMTLLLSVSELFMMLVQHLDKVLDGL